jgi:fatty acid desaturase
MNTTQRIQGGLICLGAAAAALVFLLGVFSGSYWALAFPVATLVLFVLGLVFWVGWTILTVRVEPEADQAAPDPQDD